MIASKLARISEMRGELSRLREENARLREENAALRAHADLGVLALADLGALAPDANCVIVDGWNLILGAGGAETLLGPRVHSPHELVEQARAYVASHDGDFVWIVFDGKEENVFCEGRLRVSYTGGEGVQRADRFILDFIRAAFYRGLARKISLVSRDKALLKAAKRMCG